MKYRYEAINENGEKVSGEVEADSRDAANRIIMNRDQIPLELKVSGSGATRVRRVSLADRMTAVKSRDLILMTKQLKTMLHAGVSILRTLEVLGEQTENRRLKRVVGHIATDIREGATLHEAFSSHRKVFPPLYLSLLAAGETSGALPVVLDRLIYIIEHEHKVKSDIKAALQYPAMVMSFLAVAFLILLMFVIPKFAGIFAQTGITLPAPTRICIALYEFIAAFWYLIAGGGLLGFAAVGAFFRTEPGRYARDAFLLKVPLMGMLLRKAIMSRFASIFSILQGSGINILDSMKILSGTIGNAAITRAFDRIREELSEGRGISGPLTHAGYFPPLVINMIAIGEESGNLEEMLSEISVHYDTEVEYSMKALSEAIGPILTVGLAVLVGFFALAIFLPMWDLTKMVR